MAVFSLKEIELRGGGHKNKSETEKKEDEAATEASLVASMH